jgi:2-dehydro-3-deoxygluconokinase
MTDTNTARITVANQKGGAGKTTDVIHTGGALAARGHDVLLVDIDYHGGLTCSLGYNDLYYDTDRTTLFDVLDFDQMESVNDIIVEHEEFDILPASEKLANNKNIQTLLEAPKSRERLEMTLDELEKDYDYIIVDTPPPSLNILTDNALVATGNVVIPVIPEKLNANSLQIFAVASTRTAELNCRGGATLVSMLDLSSGDPMSEIVTLGETMLRLSPESGERLETAETLGFRTAGAESNVAIAASRLGVDAAWISKLPSSPLGRRVVGDVRRHGVTPLVEWSDDRRQGTYYIEPGGEPRGTNVIYDRENAAVTSLTPEETPRDRIRSSSIFFTTGITPALSETLFETTRTLLQMDITTAFDLNYRTKLWTPEEARSAYETFLPEVDLLFAPERDARDVLGTEGDAASIADRLRYRFDCELTVVTRGSDGALASTSEGIVEQGTFDAEAVDPIGTGDAFVGGFLSRYINGASTATALEWGAATAAVKRTIDGDHAVVTEDEVAAVTNEGGPEIDR